MKFFSFMILCFGLVFAGDVDDIQGNIGLLKQRYNECLVKIEKLEKENEKYKKLLKIKENEEKVVKNHNDVKKSEKPKKNADKNVKIKHSGKKNQLKKQKEKQSQISPKKKIITKAKTYHLDFDSTIYDDINGNKVDKWEKNTSFTSYITSNGWIKISGYFTNKKWHKARRDLWIPKKQVSIKRLKGSK